MRLSANARPDEKGIETHGNGRADQNRDHVRMHAPMRRGLKPELSRWDSSIAQSSVRANARPDEKGIETIPPDQLRSLAIRLGANARPDEKGIETPSLYLFLLRRFIRANARPDEKGIETGLAPASIQMRNFVRMHAPMRRGLKPSRSGESPT